MEKQDLKVEAGGQEIKDPVDAGGKDDTDVKETVTYESYQKLLSQRKKDQEKYRETKSQLDTLLKEKENSEKKKLEEQGEYKKLLDSTNQQLQETQSKLTEADKRWEHSIKLSAIVSKLPGKVLRNEYLNFIDVDKVAINPDTGEVDAGTVETVAGQFVKDHGHLLDINVKKLPNGSPNGTAQLSYAEWLKLSGKEKMKYKPGDVKLPS